MKILDLFAGLGGWSQVARERGHEVFAVDIDPRFEVELHADVLELTPLDLPAAWGDAGVDLVLASPPCEAFSTLTFGHHWDTGRVPATEHARTSIALVSATRILIEALEPAFYVIENPRAMLRKLPAVGGLERRTVTYCQLGSDDDPQPYQKPTDLFGGFPPSLELPAPCLPRATCHTPAPRGSTTGIQGSLQAQHYGGVSYRDLAAVRAKIPRKLATLVLDAAERDLAAGRRYVPEPDLFSIWI